MGKCYIQTLLKISLGSILSNETETTGRIKNWKDAVILSLLIIVTLLAIVIVTLLPFLIVLLTSTPFDLYVEPEYVSGILAASSITCGLWAFYSGVLIGEKSSAISRKFSTFLLLKKNTV